MYNLVLDKKFTGPLGKFSPGPVPVKNKILVPVRSRSREKQNFGPGPSPGGTGTTLQFPISNTDHWDDKIKKKEKQIYRVFFRVRAERKKMSLLKGFRWTKFKVKILKYNFARNSGR
jgi:hypothetical protein